MRFVDRIKELWLKYVIGYGEPQKYWNSRWKAKLPAKISTQQVLGKEFENIRNIMEKHSCQNVLEIGCGKAILRNLPGYLGLDFSLEALKKSELTSFIYADITKQIPLPDKSQDAVLSRYVLLHIPCSEIESAVKEISRVAKNAIILREPYGTNKEQVQPHCFVHNLPELFKKYFDGHLELIQDIHN